jgi:hypothetical protein
MKFILETNQHEYGQKRDAFIEALQKNLSGLDDELVTILRKALPTKEPGLKYPVLQELHRVTKNGYEQTVTDMLVAINAVLTDSMKKSLDKAEGDEPPEYVPEEERDDGEYDEEGNPVEEERGGRARAWGRRRRT